jgi:hypothetical protein
MGEAIEHERTKKERARALLFSLWKEIGEKEIQWETRGFWNFLTKEILRSKMQWDGFPQRICFIIWAIQTGHPIEGHELPRMWFNEASGDTPQGQRCKQQFLRELAYAMCILSYEIALARGQEAMERTDEMSDLREWSRGAWVLSEAPDKIKEVWESEFDHEGWTKWAYYEGTNHGHRAEELKALGNGVVPIVAETAWRTLVRRLWDGRTGV